LLAAPHRVKEYIHQVKDYCSCGYGRTHHDLGCTGWRGEHIFFWGSCWQFFEEPCSRGPRPEPLIRWRR
jgi:hypothetical protein